jgi:hypothetical protein
MITLHMACSYFAFAYRMGKHQLLVYVYLVLLYTDVQVLALRQVVIMDAMFFPVYNLIPKSLMYVHWIKQEKNR